MTREEKLNIGRRDDGSRNQEAFGAMCPRVKGVEYGGWHSLA